MNKLILTLTALSLSFFALAKDADYKLYFEENFINPKELFKGFTYNSPNCKPLSAQESGSNKAGLELNNLDSNADYPSIFTLANLDSGKIYKLSISYKVLEFSPSNKYGFFANFEGESSGGKFKRCNSRSFGRVLGEEGEFVMYARVSSDFLSGRLDITSHKGGRLLITSLKLYACDSSPEGNWMFEKNTFIGMKILPTNTEFLSQHPKFASLSKEKFFPFIDEFGQFKHADWVGKIKNKDELKLHKDFEQEFLSANKKFENLDKFGGLIDEKFKFEPTGFFTLKKVEGKWFFITPEGNLFWSFGVNCAGVFPSTPISDREFYFDDVSEENYKTHGVWGAYYYKKLHTVYSFAKRNVDLKYGQDAANKFYAIAPKRMQAFGMNTYGAWSSKILCEAGNMPYMVFTSSKTKVMLKPKMALDRPTSKLPDFFASDFERDTFDSVAKSATEINSPYCVGVFIDNELPWQNNEGKLARVVLSCPASQPSKAAFKDFLEKKYGHVKKLNAAWLSGYSSWDDFLNNQDFLPETKESEADILAFEKLVYERYFKTCKNALKAVCGNALYLGCRFAWFNKLLQEVASQYCDAVSHNLYLNDVAGYSLPEGALDKPIMIGEFHFGNQDMGIFGGGLRTRLTYQEKLDAFVKYMKSAIENPNIVGAHWFQWLDQPTTGRHDGENFSVGLFDICDTPYYEFAKLSRELSKDMYLERFKSEGAKNKDK